MSGLIVDLFAGPGGWDEGLRSIGLTDVVGLEWDEAACKTRSQAGHRTIRCDVAQYPTKPFEGRTWGLIASPPCQAWSMAGKRAAVEDQERLGQHVEACRDGWVPYDATEYADPRTPLILEPLRWVDALHPAWIACEQVPPVLGFWYHCADVLRSWGYHSAAAELNAADHGVPQTRKRAFLTATRIGDSVLPVPTHAKGGADESLFNPSLEPWISWGAALGLDGAVIHQRRGAGMAERHGERPDTSTDNPAPTLTGSVPRRWLVLDRRTNSSDGKGGSVPTVPVPMDRPAPTLTGKAGSQWLLRNNSQTNAAIRTPDQPAPTMFFGHHLNEVGFTPDAQTPVHKGGRQITLSEASILQGFPPDYPWQGNKTKQFEQVGNAVPPPMAAAVVGALVEAQEMAA